MTHTTNKYMADNDWYQGEKNERKYLHSVNKREEKKR
jgi:hypothetical protein